MKSRIIMIQTLKDKVIFCFSLKFQIHLNTLNARNFMNKISFFLSICILFVTAKITHSDTLQDSFNDELVRTPLGDNLNVMIYDFIVDEIMKQQNISLKTLSNIHQLDQDVKKDNSLKPYPVDVSETQFSNILAQLCKGAKNCQNLSLYQKDGLVIGITDPLHQTSSFLDNPLNSLGIKELSCTTSSCTYQITWVIYKEKIASSRFVSDLSLESLHENSKKLIGFLRVTKTLKKLSND